VGQDDFSRRQALDEIKRSLGDQELLATNTTTLDGQHLTFDQLRTACETLPFLGERRLVIVSGLLERFEARNKTRQREIVPSQENEYNALVTCLTNLPDSTTLVLMDGQVKSGNRLLKALSAKARIKPFPLLRGSKLQQWVGQRVKQEGGSISLEAVKLLAKLIGSDLWSMANEINKLVLFAAGHRIEVADVERLVSRAEETSVFAMVDAILEFKGGLAEQALQKLLERGAAPAYLLVMLSRQVQLVIRAKELRRLGKTEAEIQDRLALTSEFALRKVLEQADRYPMKQVTAIYGKLLQTDLSIKTGRYGGELAFNLLIADLCQKG
jgi:DNA polymerase-3 subunit delta